MDPQPGPDWAAWTGPNPEKKFFQSLGHYIKCIKKNNLYNKYSQRDPQMSKKVKYSSTYLLTYSLVLKILKILEETMKIFLLDNLYMYTMAFAQFFNKYLGEN